MGFGNQAYTVDVKLKGESLYTTLATVDCELRPSDGGATKVTLTDTTGKLATGVEFIRFTLNQVNVVNGVPQNDGVFMMREIDVSGVSTGGDSTPPTIATLNPTDNATGVAGATDLVATFDENILSGIGNITIKNLDTSDLTEIPVGDSQVSVAGAVLTIHPTVGLAALTNYAIRIDAGAITDLANNPFAGIADDTTWNFTTSSQVQTKVFSATELAYAGDVSNSDLLTGLTATLNGNSNWNIDGNHGGANPAQLNDGIHGGSFFDVGNTCQGAQPNPGATATYHLGLGANNLGYDLTSIQSIAAWVNNGLGNQAFTVEVKLIAATDYTPLAAVNYQPLALNGVGATKVTLTDVGVGGVLATGVEFIRFTANSVNGGQTGGDFMWREIDVIGVPTGTATTTTVASSKNPSIIGEPVTFTATIVPANGTDVPTGTVQFKVDTVALGSPVTVTADVTSPNGTAVSSSTGTLTGGQTVLSQFDGWALQITDPLKCGATADPDADGAKNLIEFACNGNPNSGADQGRVYLLTEVSGEYSSPSKVLILTLAVRSGTGDFSGIIKPSAVDAADGLTYIIEGGTDLNDLSGTIYTCAAPITTGLPPAGTGYAYRSFILDSSNGLPGTGFLRARVETTP